MSGDFAYSSAFNHSPHHRGLNFESQPVNASNSSSSSSRRSSLSTFTDSPDHGIAVDPVDLDSSGSNFSLAPLSLDEIAEHDDMFQEKIKAAAQMHPKSLFGFRLYRSGRFCCPSIDVDDEARLALFLIFLIALVAALVFFLLGVFHHEIAWDTIDNNSYLIAVVVAGFFSLLAIIISLYQIYKHKQNWVHPPSQALVIRILFMVPVYSISAFFSLLFLRYSTYFDFLRLCYEAFVIYSFMILLTKYLGGAEGVLGWLNYKQPLKFPFPLCCLKPIPPDEKFLTLLKYGALQYTIITPFISLIAIILTTFDHYGDGIVSPTGGYIYIAAVQNCTQLISLYCLIWLYFVMKNELAPFKPGGKFLVVKSVVFFTFWQSILLAILVFFDILQKTEHFSVNQIQIGLQDFLVCIEMFIASIVHKYTFSYQEYANGSIKLIMEQRAVYLAQVSYKRAVEEAKRLKKRKEISERKARAAGNESGASVGNSATQATVASTSGAASLMGGFSAAAERAIERKAESILAHADAEGEIVLLDEPSVPQFIKSFHKPVIELEDFERVSDVPTGVFTIQGGPGQSGNLMPRHQVASEDYEELNGRSI